VVLSRLSYCPTLGRGIVAEEARLGVLQ